jgi:hypothetical protein
MGIHMSERNPIWRRPALALVAAGILVTPILAGCGGPDNRSASNLPPIDDSRGGYAPTYGTAEQNTKRGLSTGQKFAILAGAAALYYMYKKNKEKRAAGNMTEPQYYLSKNGRVYYRDQQGRAHWVTPPSGGIRVPMEEAQQYAQYRGYNNQSFGRDLTGLGIE